MTCKFKTKGKSEEKFDKKIFRNESDDECSNIYSNNKTKFRKLRDGNELRKLNLYDDYIHDDGRFYC